MKVSITRARRMLGLASAMLAVSLTLIVLPPRQASAAHPQQAPAAHNDCTLSVSGPFFYARMVFPNVEVTCESVKRSIRVNAAMSMDGSQVATNSRTCRMASSCVTGLASDGIFVLDIPGNQHYCGRGSALIRTKGGPTHLLPEATSCESEWF